MLIVLLALVPVCGWADGKVFSAMRVDVPIPDQRALIHFSNGVERLVIETSFAGEGTNFAWIVPLPATPEITEAPRDLLAATGRMFQPVLIHSEIPEAAFLLSFVACIFGIYFAHLPGRSRGDKLILTMLSFALLGLIWAALLPRNFVKARGQASPELVVTVQARQRVGVFDTVTLASKDGKAVMDWLEGNGFKVAPEIAPVMADYAREGWVFAAARVSRDGTQSESTMHPLMFTFATPKPVYPLRLTGVGNGLCRVELYVFAPQRAEAAHFTVEHCARAHQPLLPGADADFKSVLQDSMRQPRPGEVLVRHRFLNTWAVDGLVGTQLIGDLTAADMKADAWLDLKDFQETIPVYQTPRVALIRASNQASSVAAVLLLLLLALHFKKRIGNRTLARGVAVVVVACAGLGVSQYHSARKADIVARPYSANATVADVYQLYGGIQQVALDRRLAHSKGETLPALTFEQFCTELEPMLKGGLASPGVFANPFTGQRIRNEPTPGNLFLKPGTNGIECLWYDVAGNGHVLETFE